MLTNDPKMAELSRVIVKNSTKILMDSIIVFKKSIIASINKAMYRYIQTYNTGEPPLLEVSTQMLEQIKSQYMSLKDNIKAVLSFSVSLQKKNEDICRASTSKLKTPHEETIQTAKPAQSDEMIAASKQLPVIHWAANKVLYITQNFTQIHAFDIRAVPFVSKSAYINNKIYFTGGLNAKGECSASCIEFNCQTLKLMQKKEMIHPKMHHAVATSNSHLYTLAGCTNNCVNLTRYCERYSFATDKWEELPVTLNARCGAVCVIQNQSMVYLIGGYLENGPTNEIECLDAYFIARWTALKTSGNPTMFNTIGVPISSKDILIVGGMQHDETSTVCWRMSMNGRKCVLAYDSNLKAATHFCDSPAPVISDGFAYCVDSLQNILKYKISSQEWLYWKKPDLASIPIRFLSLIK